MTGQPKMTAGDAWERDWRGDVMRQLRESGEALQQTAVSLERLNGRLDEHDRRISALESQPAQVRAKVSSYGAFSVNVALAVIALLALTVSLASHITLH